MRGSISYADAMNLNSQEREIVGGIIKSNLEFSKESKMPFW